MKKLKYLTTLLLFMFFCCSCGTTEANQDQEVNSSESNQVAIPENATEIISNIGIEVHLDSDVPIITMYDCTDDPAPAVYTYMYLLSVLTENQNDYRIVLCSGNETIETSSLEEKNAKSVEEVSMPAAWLDFVTEKEIGNGKVTISDFVSKEIAAQIVEKLQQNVFDVILENHTETTVDASSKNTLLSETYTLDSNEIIFDLFEVEGEIYSLVNNNTSNKEHASMFMAYFYDVFSKMDDSNIDGYTIMCTCDDKVATIIFVDDKKTIGGTNSDGSYVEGSFPDWIITDIEKLETPQDELQAFMLELQGIAKTLVEKFE